MSHRKLPKKKTDNQTVITEFMDSVNIEEIQEKAKLLKLTVSNQERAKPIQTPVSTSNPIKRKTPPSLEKEELSKKLHYESSPDLKMLNPSKKEIDNSQEPELLEDRIVAKIELLLKPLKESIDKLEEQWTNHREEIKQLRDENWKLKRRVQTVEICNKKLMDQVKKLEDAKLENNVILQGLPEAPWETDEVCRERLAAILADLVHRETLEERIAIVKKIPIKSITRIGYYNPMRCHPVSVEFECLGDVEYLIENKQNLKKGVYVDC